MSTTKQQQSVNWYFFLGTIVVCRLLAHHVFPLLDDAYITFRYARNLASGLGFVYNAGEWVQGITCPGFGVMLAEFNWLGIDLPTFVPLLNVAIDLLIFYLAVTYVLNSFDSANVAIFGFLFAVSPACNYICVGGMEVNLFLVVSLLSIILFTSGRPVWGILLASLSIFLRPEGVLLIALLFIRILYSRQYRLLLIATIWTAVTAAVYILVSYRFYGTILPQSIVAKSGLVGSSFFHVFQRLIFPDYFGIVLLPLAIIGAISLWRRNRSAAIVIEWSALYALAYLIARPMIASWYTLPIQFSLLLFGSNGFVILVQKSVKLWKWIVVIPVWVFGLLAILVWGGVATIHGEQSSKKNVFRPLAQFCSREDMFGKTIATYDIGVLGYYSNAIIYDMTGLVWLPAKTTPDFQSVVGKFSPDYLMVSAKKSEMEEMQPERLGKLYEPMKRFSIFGETNLTPDYRTLPDEYYLDYIIFKKKEK